MKKTYITSAMISATMALTATCAHSAGYMIQETNGTMGQAFAGRAVAIEDASTMFVNPAVMAYQDKHQLIVQNFFIMPKSKLHTKSATTTRSSARSKLIPKPKDQHSPR